MTGRVLNAVKNNLRYDSENGIVTRIRQKNRYGYFSCNETCGTLSHGYLRTRVLDESIANHRIAWFFITGRFPRDGMDIDHINGIKTDNRWCNLRQATRSQNNMNSGNPKNNTTGQKGVHPTRDRWFARIKVKGKIIHLGVFKLFEEAVSARKAAELKYFGEFSRTI